MTTTLPRLAVAMCAMCLFVMPSSGDDTHQLKVRIAHAPAGLELVFIDGSVAGASELQAGMREGMETFIVDARADLISEITAKLRQRSGIKVVRILSHAAPGVLKLGETSLDVAALEQRAGLISTWSQAMAKDGRVVFYGCDLASEDAGRRWMERFASISGLAVAASTDKTGSAPLGGDWDLEAHAGAVLDEETPLFQPGYEYQGLLPVPLTGVDPNFNSVYVRPGSASNTWTFGVFNSSGHSGSGIPDGPNVIKEVAYGNSGASILNRGKFQYSTNGGDSWVDFPYGTFPGLAVSGKVFRFLDLTPGDTTNNDDCFTYWTYMSIPGASTSTGQNIIVDNEPTDVFPATTDYWATANGELVADLAVTDTGNPNGGVYVIESQGVANLFTLTGSSLSLGSGSLPSVGAGATLGLRYYDYYQTDSTGAPIAGQGVTRTVTMIRRSNPFGFSNDAKANTFTTNGQTASQPARLSDGSYVVVWRSVGQNGETTSTGGIYGQKFTASGVASGAEFAISPGTNGKNETAPAVAGLSGGRFVVAYTQPNTDNDVIFRIVEADGTLGAETSVTATTGAQSAASVAALTDGNFAIAFIGPNGADTADVWVRKFDGTTGAAISGSELVVNTTQANTQSLPAVSALSDGNYVVSWRDSANGGDIFCRVMGASAAVSSQITVVGGAATQANPRCSGLTGGGFVVTYNEAGRTEGSVVDTTSQSNVYARLYNNAGTAQGVEILVNGGTRGNQINSGISRLTNGGFVIGFSSNTDPDGSSGIFGRRFDASGNAVDVHEFQMNQRRIDSQTAVSLAGLDNSGFAASWTDGTLDGASDSGIGTRAFSGSAPAAPEIAVTESAANVADGGSLSFGSTTVGTPVTKTFTVTNSGTATLNLSGLSVPSGFTIAQGFGSSTVASGGGSTTFKITMSAAAAATPSGTLTFVTDDLDENPYNFTVSGTVAAPPSVSSFGTPAFVTVADSMASYTVPSGSNRLLLVTVSHADTTETAAASAVSFAGQPMTQVGVRKDGSSVDSIWARVLGSGSAVTGAIVATRYPSMGTRPVSFLSAQAFENVDQTTPTSGTTTNANTTAGNSSINVTSAVGDMVMDLYDVWKLSGAPSPSMNGGQTLLNNSGALAITANNLASYGGTAQYQTSTKPGAAGTVTMGWTATADAAIQVGLNIRQATSGGGSPEIAVTESAANVADGGSLSFGTTAVGTPVTKTFTVNNTGTATLNLSNLTVPSGFSIAQNFVSSTVTAAGSTTFQVTMTAAAAATPSGTLSFDTNDSDENPYNFTVSGTVSAPAITGTMMFTNNNGLSDGIAQDGEAGSSDIPGITMQVFNISDTAGTLFPSLSWQDNAWLSSNNSSLSALTYTQNAGTKGMAIKSSDGSEFQLNQFLYYNWGETTSTTITVKGYRNTVEVASTTFAGYNAAAAPTTVNLDSSFDNVDDVRLYISAGGYMLDQSASNHSLNNIVIAPPVAAPPAPEIAVSGNSNNIPDGALLAAASTTNATDFGSTPVQGGLVEMSYTISNSGDASLELTNGPNYVTVVPSTDFSVTQQPAGSIAAGGTTTFKVAFNPTTAATTSATVSFGNDDSNENPFDFVVKGTGTGPQTFDLAGNAVSNTPFDGGQTYIYTPVPPYVGSTGVLDSTFDSDGKVVHPFGNAGDGAYGVAIQSDGKIVATGYTLNTGTSVNNVPVVRYNTNGSFDTSFDGDGKVSSVFGTHDAWANGVAIQSDGKIVVAGMATAGASGKVFLVARYTSSGSLDTSFAAVGYVMTDVSASVHEDIAHGLVIQGDGKIVVAGACDTGSQGRQFAIVRYTSGGLLDTDFGSGGKVFTDFTTGDDIARAVTIQPDGKIIVVGEAGASSDFAAARYNADGTLDTTFNTTGKFTHSITAGTDGARGVGVQSSGAIVLGGFAGTGNSRDMALVRLTSTGLLDTTFNSTGVVTTAIGSGVDEARSLLVQPDDKLILVGASHNGTNHDVAVVRYTSEGVLDTGFNTTGKVVTPVGTGNDVGSAAALQSTGEIVVAGESTVGNNQDFLLLRYGLGNVPSTSAEIVVEQPADTGLLDGTSSIAFGSVEVASTVTKTFTIKNTGTGALNLIGVSFTGTDAADFSASAFGSSTVAATNGSTTFDVTFSPLGAGARSAVLHIASEDADEASFDIQVTGTGLNFIGGTWTESTPLVSTSGPFDADGLSFETDLGFAPSPPGTTYTFLHADGGVTGEFNDLPDGGVVAMAFNGVIYYFQVEYSGNDITLTYFTPSDDPAWTWVGGPKARNGIGVYGTLGTAAATNNPGARQGAMNWRAPDGSLWMFGGYGHGSVSTPIPRYLNDVWQYRRDIGQWVWRAGANVVNQVGVYGTQGTEAPGNTPGSRHSGTTWTDSDGNLWLFGGYGVGSTAAGAAPLNDLWRFNPSNAQWTHMKGSDLINGTATYGTQGAAAAANTPGSRSNAAGFYRNGSLWLFGGYSGSDYYNDLWRYDIASGNWTWVGGSSTPNQNGVYGTQGTAAAGNMPGSRRDATAWTALDGTLWLFGGLGLAESGAVAADMSDLWSYDPVTGNWTWRKGVKTTGAAGVYGAVNTPATTNLPGARSAGSGWVTVDGDLWLVAGFKDSNQSFDDVWIYDIASSQWTWKLGSQGLLNQSGVHGTQGEADPANKPGGRYTPSTWVTLNGTLWIFGGGGADGLGGTGRLSDLWSYGIPMPNGAMNDSGSLAAFPDSLILNAAPSTRDATAGTMAYVPVTGTLTGEDADGDPIKFNSAGATAGSKGTLTLNSDGTWTYTPAYGFTGLASFQFKANDNYGGVSSVKTLIISVIPNPADSDGDGIADEFEQQMWGSLAAADGDGDADLDGQTNYFEFLAGTNPLDGGERLGTTPTISGAGTASGGVQLQLNHVRPGVNYHLETSPDLEAWSRIGTFTFDAAGSATIEDPAPSSGAPRFYRMSLEATPAVIVP